MANCRYFAPHGVTSAAGRGITPQSLKVGHLSFNESMSRYQENQVPPTLEARVQMFMDLSQEYLELVPVMKSRQIWLVGDNENIRFHKRTVALHLSLVRKFITKEDQVYLGTLNNQIVRELGEILPSPITKALKGQQHELAKLDRSLFVDESCRIIGEDNQEVDQAQALYNFQYGRILHTDYGKWVKAQDWHAAYSQAASSLSNARKLLWYTRSCFVYLQKNGYLPDIKYQQVIYEEIWNGKGEYLGRREKTHIELESPR